MINDTEHQQHEHASELGEMTSAQFLEQIVVLWEGLATELTWIIGDGGFRILFARSVSIAYEKSLLMRNFRFPLQDESPFLYLRTRFAGRDISEMRNANALILSSFTETLSSLVGNTLTIDLLRPTRELHRLPDANEPGRQSHPDSQSASK